MLYYSAATVRRGIWCDDRYDIIVFLPDETQTLDKWSAATIDLSNKELQNFMIIYTVPPCTVENLRHQTSKDLANKIWLSNN